MNFLHKCTFQLLHNGQITHQVSILLVSKRACAIYNINKYMYLYIHININSTFFH